jgi:hypothetical protein
MEKATTLRVMTVKQANTPIPVHQNARNVNRVNILTNLVPAAAKSVQRARMQMRLALPLASIALPELTHLRDQPNAQSALQVCTRLKVRVSAMLVVMVKPPILAPPVAPPVMPVSILKMVTIAVPTAPLDVTLPLRAQRNATTVMLALHPRRAHHHALSANQESMLSSQAALVPTVRKARSL